MAFTQLLAHRARIQERESREDRFGQPQLTFLDKADRVPCYLSHAGGTGEQLTLGSRDTIKADYTIFFGPDVNINETDRIAEVLDAGDVVIATNLEVIHVRKRTSAIYHHIEVDVILVRDSAHV